MNMRKAKLEDIEMNLLDLYIEGYNIHYNSRPDIFSNKDKSELRNNLISIINESNILVLEKDKKILGYAIYQIKEKNNKTIWIDQLIIDENSRHQGNGKKLMEKIKQIATEENCKRIEFCCWSFNKEAMDMYKHIGYREQRVVLEIDL